MQLRYTPFILIGSLVLTLAPGASQAEELPVPEVAAVAQPTLDSPDPLTVREDDSPRGVARAKVDDLVAFSAGPGILAAGYTVVKEVGRVEAYVVESRNGGATWDPPVRLGTGVHGRGTTTWPKGQAPKSGAAVVWPQGNDITVSVRTASRDGRWTTYSVKRPEGVGLDPPIRADAEVMSDGTALVAWTEDRYGAWFATVSPNGAVSPAQALTPTASNVFLAQDEDGEVYAFTTGYGVTQTLVQTYAAGSGWSRATRVCECQALSVLSGGSGQFLLTMAGKTMVIDMRGPEPKAVTIPGYGSFGMGGGKVFAAVWESSNGRSTLTRSAVDPSSGTKSGSVALTSASERVPGYPDDWDARHPGGTAEVVVDPRGVPTVAATWARSTCADPFLPKAQPRRVDYDECSQGELYLASGLRVDVVEVASLDRVRYSLAMSSNGEGVLAWLEPTRYCTVDCEFAILTRSFGERTEPDSCVLIPGDGGPLPVEARAVRPRNSSVETTSSTIRFGSVEARGCFEPLGKSDSRWRKFVNGAGFWVNSSDLTRINGIDVPAPPGALLFDTKAMYIRWLPTSEVALAFQGAVFYRMMSKGTLKDAFSLKVGLAKTVTTLKVPPQKGRILGAELRAGSALIFEMFVDRSPGGVGGYTQVKTTMGIGGALLPSKIKNNAGAVDRTKCRPSQMNVVVRNGPDLMRCEPINPNAPGRPLTRWVKLDPEAVLVGLSFTVRASNERGIELSEVKGSIKKLNVGPVQLEDVEVGYVPASQGNPAIWSLKGSTGIKVGVGKAKRDLKVTLGGALAYDSSPTAKSSLYLQSLTFGVEGILIPTGGPTAIQRISGTWDGGDARGGWSLAGSLAWVIGPPIPIGGEAYDAASLDVTFTYAAAKADDPSVPGSQAEPARFTMQGSGAIVGVPLGQVTASMTMTDGFPSAPLRLEIEGDTTLDRLPWTWVKKLGVSGSGKLVGYYDFVSRKWQFQLAARDLSISSLGIGPVGGDVMISDRGIAMCAQNTTVSVVAVGFSYFWKAARPVTYTNSCDVGVVKSGG